MSASSVTGIGQGAVAQNKGSERMTFGSNHIVGVRLVDVGQASLTSGTPSTCNVPFTHTLTSATGYYAFVQPVGATSGSASDLSVSNVSTTGFTVTGPNSVSTTFNWQLVFNGTGNTVSTGQG